MMRVPEGSKRGFQWSLITTPPYCFSLVLDPAIMATKGIEDGARAPRDSEASMFNYSMPMFYSFAGWPLI